MAEQQQQVSEASRQTAKRGLSAVNGDESLKDSRICTKAINEMAAYIDQDKADLVDQCHQLLFERAREKHGAPVAMSLSKTLQWPEFAPDEVDVLCELARQALARHTPQGAKSDDTAG